MRTLNRPMFRYGGPIKEGVMHGIREPRRNGGSMGKTLLVGQHPAQFKDAGGREQHWAPLMYGLAAAGRALARPFGSWAMKKFGPGVARAATGPTKNSWGILTGQGSKEIAKQGPTLEKNVFTPYKFWSKDPLFKAGATGAGWAGKALQKGGQFAKYATTSPSGLLFFGAPVTYAAGKYFLSDGKEIKGDDLNNITQGEKRGVSGAPGGGDPDMTYTAPEKELTAAEIEAAEAENRIKQMDTYKEIMNIKGMKKDAVYKSLIDVSKQIQEGGSLKEQLKSGSLISNLTQAASKRFDKVADTETALRSLVAKGEIENQLNKEDKDLKRKALKTNIAIGEKTLSGASLGETLTKYRITNKSNASGGTLKGFLEDKNIPVVDVAETKKVDKHIKDGGTAVSFMESIVVENLKNNKEVTPGIYVVKDTIIQIDENGKVTKVRP